MRMRLSLPLFSSLLLLHEIVGLHDLSSSESVSGGKELEAGKEEGDAAKKTLAVLVEQLARWKGRGGSG